MVIAVLQNLLEKNGPHQFLARALFNSLPVVNPRFGQRKNAKKGAVLLILKEHTSLQENDRYKRTLFFLDVLFQSLPATTAIVCPFDTVHNTPVLSYRFF